MHEGKTQLGTIYRAENTIYRGHDYSLNLVIGGELDDQLIAFFWSHMNLKLVVDQ